MEIWFTIISFSLSLNTLCVAITNTSAGRGIGGHEFSDYSEWTASGWQKITQVLMTCESHYGRTVLSIRISYGNVEGETHGSYADPGSINYTLHDGEYITGADIWYDEFINGITLITNYADIPHCGLKKNDMISFRETALLYISGFSGWYVDTLTFHWFEGSDSCQGFRCSGNGICGQIYDGYKCICDEGFTGIFCESRYDSCQGIRCSGNGICRQIEDGYKCICDEGFTGISCESMVQPICNCTCGNRVPPWNNTKGISEFGENRNTQVIQKKETSMYKRRLYSASDARLSASITGYGLGVTTLVLVFVLIVLMDVFYFMDQRKRSTKIKNGKA